MTKDCKECIRSRLVLSENGYRACCTLSYRDSKKCLENDRSKFEGNRLFLMCNKEADK